MSKVFHVNHRELTTWTDAKGFFLIILCVGAIYFPTLSFEFTNWDDPSYVQNNQAIQSPGWWGLKEIFTKSIPASHGDYIPVTIFSYWVDYQLWRFQPTGYHLTNVLFHAMSTGLLFLLLRRLTLRPGISLMVTFLFALHPMNTEAITWIAERKSVTAMFWMLLSFHGFLSWQEGLKDRRGYLYLSLWLYSLACLSKTAVIFFPLLLVSYQICLARVEMRRSVVTVLSFFLISVFIGAGRILGHWASGQISWKPFETAWAQLFTILEIFGFYLEKLLLPANLNNSYSLEIASSLFEPGVLCGLLSMLGMLILVARCMKSCPLVSFGLLWYLSAWLPHSQLIVIPPALRADRYVYYSSPGLFLALMCGIEQGVIWSRQGSTSKRLRVAICAVGFIVAGAFASMTVLRNDVWSDSISLWCDSLKKDYRNPLAHTNLGTAYSDNGMFDKAIYEHQQVLALNPKYSVAHYNLGDVYARQGRLDEAITEYKLSLALDPNYKEAHTNLGNTYYKKGRLDEAIFEHKQSLAIEPDYAKAHNNLGVAYGGKGKLDEAIAEFRKALIINPYFADAHNNLSVACYYAGDYRLAIKHCDKAIELGYNVNRKLLEMLKPYR